MDGSKTYQRTQVFLGKLELWEYNWGGQRYCSYHVVQSNLGYLDGLDKIGRFLGGDGGEDFITKDGIL